MDGFPEVKIVTHGITSEVYINGNRIDGISKWSVVHEAGKLPKLCLDILGAQMEVTSNRIPELPDIYQPFYVSALQLVNSGLVTEEQINELTSSDV